MQGGVQTYSVNNAADSNIRTHVYGNSTLSSGNAADAGYRHVYAQYNVVESHNAVKFDFGSAITCRWTVYRGVVA